MTIHLKPQEVTNGNGLYNQHALRLCGLNEMADNFEIN